MVKTCIVLFVITLIARPIVAGEVLPSLQPNLINHFTFDNPENGDPKSIVELDLGSDKVNINLLNGAPRVPDGAWSGSKYSLETGQKNTKPNDDWKAGVMFQSSADSKLHGSQNVAGVTIMGWFKPLAGPEGNPSINTNQPNSTTRYNAFGLAGLLRGDEGVGKLDGHVVRALLEVIGGKVTAMGRRLDNQSASGQLPSVDSWDVVMPPNKWTHLAASIDFANGKMALYKNGQPLATGALNVRSWLSTGDSRTSNTAAGGIKIGGSHPNNQTEQNPFNGRIDELMFFNKALSAEEVASQYKLISDPNPAGMTR
ncbi:MAG TPA: LamG domain-containing protein [Tepidisphaeraceae bacterium]|nr:LamG domain-containing protein [Tepidisphaeraceae bacterium]